MNAILTKEQVDLLNYKESKTALKLLNKTYRMDTTWTELTKEEKDMCDDIGNTLLWLEDRIREFEDPRVSSMDPTAAVVTVEVAEKKPRTNYARKVMVLGVPYESVKAASLKTGIKVGTIHAYVKRRPDQYYYID